ncbi:MAG TPA: SMC-Scp complex subunit ScpB [Longimicrobiales bacterium]|nr:SMC-Scp complex subunit ScpB [Longimicrobiales bacterium]
MTLQRIVEALLFASDAPLSAADIARAEPDVTEAEVAAAIEALRGEYDATERAFGVYELAGGYQILTRPEFVPYLERFATVGRPARVSAAALEALAIVAYRQPIERAEIEEIRGVGSSGVLRTLLERDLIDVVGRGEGLGRPLQYGTTPRFLEHFGYASLEDLPRPEDLPVVLRREFGLAGEDPAGGADGSAGEDAGSPGLAAAERTGDGDAPDSLGTADDGNGDEDPEAARARRALAVEAEVERVVSAASHRHDPVD